MQIRKGRLSDREAALFQFHLREVYASGFSGPNFLRPRIAAAASPNRIIIGGAGTSVPPLLLDEELEPEEDELLEELDPP